jgi:hypothetical protein
LALSDTDDDVDLYTGILANTLFCSSHELIEDDNDDDTGAAAAAGVVTPASVFFLVDLVLVVVVAIVESLLFSFVVGDEVSLFTLEDFFRGNDLTVLAAAVMLLSSVETTTGDDDDCDASDNFGATAAAAAIVRLRVFVWFSPSLARGGFISVSLEEAVAGVGFDVFGGFAIFVSKVVGVSSVVVLLAAPMTFFLEAISFFKEAEETFGCSFSSFVRCSILLRRYGVSVRDNGLLLNRAFVRQNNADRTTRLDNKCLISSICLHQSLLFEFSRLMPCSFLLKVTIDQLTT